MVDYKLQAATFAATLVKPGAQVGLGAGASVAHLARALANQKELMSTLTLYTSAAPTRQLLVDLGLRTLPAGDVAAIDWYFDGCDQVDRQLNALKSGGGIHTDEKILATMASQFVLLADISKLVDLLDAQYPLVLEVLPDAREKVVNTLSGLFPSVKISFRKEGDQFRVTSRNNLLADLHFDTLPPLSELQHTKSITGVVEHSLFYKLASQAIVAGENGTLQLFRQPA